MRKRSSFLKVYLFIFFFLEGSLFSFIWANDEFSCMNLRDNCEFYSCIDEVRNCGRKGYSRSFGLKYCLKFKKKRPKFRLEGKLWLDRVRLCLMDKVYTFGPKLSCKEFKKKAFASHTGCYIDSGFCSLSLKDKKQLSKIVFPALWRPTIIIQSLNVLKLCKRKKLLSFGLE